MIIAVDFDGTCVTHEFPKVGKDIGAAPVLRKLVQAGHKLILWTMRHDSEDELISEDKDIHTVAHPYLTEAKLWFENNGIELYGCQCNPTQHTWTGSPKCYAQIYVDDAALGCPLKIDKSYSDRPFVDWDAVEKYFFNSEPSHEAV